MGSVYEVAVTTESSGQFWNACVWDPRTGTSLMTYKGGGVAAPHSLCLLGKDYLMISDYTKPLLHAWHLNSQQSLSAQGLRLICPGRVNAMAVSPDGCYCVTAVVEKLLIWQLASGRQLAVAVNHFQAVTCICFTDDGSHFASGGDDGLVLVWSLSYLISSHIGEIVSGHAEPRYIFSGHSLPVRDLFIGSGGMRARLMSVSVDRTCKLYDLASGNLLLSLVFDCALSAVTFSATEAEVFVGSVDGNIYQFGLQAPPRAIEYHLTKEEKAKKFVGHTKAITCLSASLDGLTLLSGSMDSNVMFWNIPSKQCVRVIQHKGPVTNAFLTFAPNNIFAEEMKPTITLQNFQRSLESDNVTLSIRTVKSNWDALGEDDIPINGSRHFNQKSLADVSEESNLKEQIAALKKINSDLYGFAVNKILRGNSSNIFSSNSEAPINMEHSDE